MKEEIIQKVSNILNAWNPLGDKSKEIDDLDGYHAEAIDIISTINFMSGNNKIEKAISQVLEQAFEITPSKEEASKVALEIGAVLLDKKYN
jgi:hypothetical protein